MVKEDLVIEMGMMKVHCSQQQLQDGLEVGLAEIRSGSYSGEKKMILLAIFFQLHFQVLLKSYK